MKRIFFWLLQPWVLSLLGVTVMAIVVWHEGPLVSYNNSAPLEAASTRWKVVAVIVLVWAGYWLWRLGGEKLRMLRLKHAAASAQEQGDAGVSTSGAARAIQLADMTRQFQEVLRSIRRSRVRGGTSPYRLPWYLLIGVPGAGKTAALAQSGLRFPLTPSTSPGTLPEGELRTCEWWLAEEAVLVDTAGRLTLQEDGDANAAPIWMGLLELLKRQRRRQPVNGVLIAISTEELLNRDIASRKRLVLALRARLKDLHDVFGIRFPVYVLVTKADLLAGFADFFRDLEPEGRDQPWGVTFPVGDAESLPRHLSNLTQELDALEGRLQARLLPRMQKERDLRKRALLFAFPQQFASLGEDLIGLMNDIFMPSQFEAEAMFRGVYFTSSLHEGVPVDRVVSTLARSFSLQGPARSGAAARAESFFLTRVLRDAIFREAGLAGANLKLERHRRLLQIGAMVMLGGFLAFSLGARSISFVRNYALVERTDAHVAEIAALAQTTSRSATLTGVLPLLDAARSTPVGYEERDAYVPPLMRIGLYQGGRLGPAANDLYRRLLMEALLPRLVARLEDQLRRGAANPDDVLYEALRHYLMFGQKKHFDAGALLAWFQIDLGTQAAVLGQEQLASLLTHIEAGLAFAAEDDGPLHKVDDALVEEVRLELARQPLPQRLYARLKRNFDHLELSEFSASHAVGQAASLFLVRVSGEPISRGVPGMYTLAGYRKFAEEADRAIADIAADGWVLGKHESLQGLGDTESLHVALRALYKADYIEVWDSYLADITLPTFSSLEEGARMAALVSGIDSPLKKFLRAVAAETRLGGARSANIVAESVVKTVKSKLDAYRKKLEANLGMADASQPASARESDPVDSHFQALHRFAGAATGGAAPIDQMLVLMKEVAAYFEEAERMRRAGLAPPASDVLGKLRREASDKPAPLGAILQGFAAAGGAFAVGGDRARLNAAWGGIASYCRQAIEGRYPIVRKESAEILPDDFGRFFSPGGMMDDYFQKYLRPYVDTSEQKWRWRPGSGASLGISDGVLEAFQRAAGVRDMYFANGARQPVLRFELEPLEPGEVIDGLRLEVDGLAWEAAPGKLMPPTPFILPSGKRTGIAELAFGGPGQATNLRAVGNWAWWRLIDQGKLEPTTQPERFRLGFELQGKKILFRLTASSVVNPFRREVLEGFHCPDAL